MYQAQRTDSKGEAEKSIYKIGKKIHDDILYDNGCVSRVEPYYIRAKWLQRINKKLKVFAKYNRLIPLGVLANDIEALDYDSLEIKYKHIKGYKALSRMLDKFFNSL